ncbi:N-acetylmuramoyl-L-alanine amidase [Prevotella disiens]|uniref:N-acetylmuramoyl-L-alanine amidase n=1 Tax=Prevotella disiens TaxID=28130 RepID=UPI00242A7D1B|nr:N-acetylmuramoyl-L-alanine amidase [Prevotella disiens]
MRKINEIIVHCTATQDGKNIKVEDINRWHKQRGWNMIGYHYVVYLDGTIHQGRSEDQIGAHCLKHNTNSIGVVYVGGLDANGNPKDTRTEAQKQGLRKLLTELKRKYPKAAIHSHKDFAPKACPSFDATHEYKDI